MRQDSFFVRNCFKNNLLNPLNPVIPLRIHQFELEVICSGRAKVRA